MGDISYRNQPEHAQIVKRSSGLTNLERLAAGREKSNFPRFTQPQTSSDIGTTTKFSVQIADPTIRFLRSLQSVLQSVEADLNRFQKTILFKASAESTLIEFKVRWGTSSDHCFHASIQ
jgi:hypothetical protein